MICLDPNSHIRVVLAHDKGKHQDQQPALFYRAMNGREWRKYAAELDRIDTLSGDERLIAIYQANQTNLVNWVNAGREFIAADLDLILAPYEAEELIRKLTVVMLAGPEDKKKLELPTTSDMDKSVEPAEAESVSTLPVPSLEV